MAIGARATELRHVQEAWALIAASSVTAGTGNREQGTGPTGSRSPFTVHAVPQTPARPAAPCRYRPVCDPSTSATSSGVPCATTCPPSSPGLGPHVDDPVGPLDHVQVMLDDQHGVPRIHQAVEHADQHPHVVEVQPGGRLVEDVELPPRLLARLRQLPRDLEPLRLAARERGGRLAQPQVAEPDLLQVPERRAQLRLVPEARRSPPPRSTAARRGSSGRGSSRRALPA